MSRVETAPLVAGEVEEGPSPVQPPARPSAAVVTRLHRQRNGEQLMILVDPQVAMDKLAALGSSQAIAEFMHAEHLTGMRGSGAACPVSWYLRRETGWRVVVSPTTWSLRARDLPEGLRRNYRTPEPVREFINDLDGGRYAHLAWSVPGEEDPG